MKFSRKMILIPASGREEPENEKMSELDLEMSAIVKNPNYSIFFLRRFDFFIASSYKCS